MQKGCLGFFSVKRSEVSDFNRMFDDWVDGKEDPEDPVENEDEKKPELEEDDENWLSSLSELDLKKHLSNLFAKKELCENAIRETLEELKLRKSRENNELY